MKLFLKLLTISFLFLTFISCIKTNSSSNLVLSGDNTLVDRSSDLIPEIEEASIALVNDNGNAFCGGTWISNQYIITARHCLEDTFTTDAVGETIGFKTFNEINRKYPLEKSEVYHHAVVFAVGSKSDLGVLFVEEKMTHKIAAIRSGEMRLGEKLHIIGHPSGLEFTYLPGFVSQIRNYKRTYAFSMFNVVNMDQKVIQVNADVWFGNSGGAAFDSQGNLVGIASFLREDRGMSFFIHKDLVTKFLDENKIDYYLRI